MTTTFSDPGAAPTRITPPAPTVESFLDVRARTEALAAPLSPEDQVVQSMPDASPTKWHRAHVTWFFEELVLAPHLPHHRWFDEDFRYLFNSYYEAVGPRQPRPRRGMITRPDVTTVARYRDHVDAAMVEALRDGLLPRHGLDLVELGLHHEQQHQELLLMDVQHLLWQNPLAPAYRNDRTGEDRRRGDRRGDDGPGAGGPPASRSEDAHRSTGWFHHDGGVVAVGHRGDGFAYDNEGPCHQVLLAPFHMAEALVTCGDWAEFIDDGGYRRSDLWLSDGWAIVQAEDRQAPLYWSGDAGSEWEVFGLDGLRQLDPQEPVCNISYHEADAFARWAGARLPTEAEWEAVAAEHWNPLDDPFGFTGAVWQWTASAYLPYPGFAAAPGAVGEYNGKFMVSQHVLRGGSHATPPGHERLTYRNFFPPAARWAYSGVRLARD